MPPKSPQPPSEAAEQARAEQLRLAEAYQAVFGKEGKRSEAQKLVWADLRVGVDDEKDSTFKLSTPNLDGLTLIAQGLKRDGAKGIIRHINLRLSQVATLRENPKAGRPVKR